MPQEWITQTRPGGVVLLPLDRRNCGGLLARLSVQSGGIAYGRLLPDFGGFMPLRQLNRHDAADHAFRTVEDGQGDTRHTSLPVDIITQEANPFEFFAALTLPGGGWNHLIFTPSNGDPAETWLAQGDGSWRVTPRRQAAPTQSAKAGRPDSGIRSKTHTSSGTRLADPPATASVSLSTTANTPSGSIAQTANTSGCSRKLSLAPTGPPRRG